MTLVKKVSQPLTAADLTMNIKLNTNQAGKKVDGEELALDGEVVVLNFHGMSITCSTSLRPDHVWVVRESPIVLFGTQVATWFRQAPTWRRQEVLDDLLRIIKNGPSNTPTTYETLIPTGDPMKYTVGESRKKAVQPQRERAAAERKKRLGIDPTGDRVAELGKDARHLLNQAGTLNEMTEGQFVEFTTRRIALTTRARALMEELEQVQADIELVEFACDEADAR